MSSGELVAVTVHPLETATRQAHGVGLAGLRQDVHGARVEHDDEVAGLDLLGTWTTQTHADVHP